tara:strand:- start:1224 stop:1676 length:453 start_codon:yes stop_codon:yes gene_type:complete
MRLVIQRVKKAGVYIDERLHSKINNGLLILIGIAHEDVKEDADYLVSKCSKLRVFDDHEGKMNLSIKDVKGEVLLVSQFTLHASTKKGNRPSYINAADPESATILYNYFIQEMNFAISQQVKTGVFGANMQVELINDGPVTILIDSKNKE